MKLRKWSLRGVTRFVEPLAIDLSDQSGIVCIVGENGAGKTTAVEAVVLALYGRLAWYPGAPFDHCRGRDAFVEVEFEAEDGRSIIVRRLIDAEARKQEAYLIIDGEAVTSGRVREIQPAIERLFGPADLFLASVFGDQRRAGSFLDAAPAERKALLAELLQLGELESIAADARAQRVAVDAHLATERARAEQLADVERQLADACEALEDRHRELEVMRGDAKDEAARAERIRAELDAAVKAEQETEHLDRAVRGAYSESAQADANLREAMRNAEQGNARWNERLRGLDRRIEEAEASKLDIQRRTSANLEILTTREASARETLASAPAVAAAKRVLAERERQLAERREAERGRSEIAHAIDELRGDLRDLESVLAWERERRAEKLRDLSARRALLDRVPCREAGAWCAYGASEAMAWDLAAECPLLANAREADAQFVEIEAEPAGFAVAEQAIADKRREIERAEKDLAAADDALEAMPTALEIERAIQEARAIAKREPVLEQASRTLSEIEGDRARLEEAGRDVFERAGKLVAELRDERDRVLDESVRERVQFEEAIATRAEQQKQARAKLEAARAELAAARGRAADVAQIRARLDEIEATRQRTAREIERLVAAVARLEGRIDELRTAAGQRAAALAAIARLERELGDWLLLERGFGREGVQALEIDVAGPEIARLTNELLAACYGPRFSVSLETLREKRAGGTAETLDVQIYDGATVRQHVSGGEQCIVEEALKLALSIYNARKSGIRWRTLWRDETVGPLDPENAERYVRMMRRALELGGFECAIVIAHSREVWESADARIVLEDGRARVAA